MAKFFDIDLRALDILLKAPGEGGPTTVSLHTSGRATRYWRPNEFGSVPGQSPWPRPGRRTTLAGGGIHSKQAPKGFVGVHAAEFCNLLKRAYLDILRNVQRALNVFELKNAAHAVGQDAVKMLQSTAPVDSGALKSSIHLEDR